MRWTFDLNIATGAEGYALSLGQLQDELLMKVAQFAFSALQTISGRRISGSISIFMSCLTFT